MKKSNFGLFYTILLLSLLLPSCKKEAVTGCTDPLGDNYDASAEVSDSSCTYQKRFLGEYTGQIACRGLFATAFTMANLSVNELIKKDEVNIIIQSTIGPLPVKGILTKNTITVDQLLTGLKVNLKDLNPLAPDEIIDADGTIKTVLTVSDDNKTLTGVIAIALIPKKDVNILGLIFPAGTPLPDQCDFVGTKK
jgi:hypothetical protein